MMLSRQYPRATQGSGVWLRAVAIVVTSTFLLSWSGFTHALAIVTLKNALYSESAFANGKGTALITENPVPVSETVDPINSCGVSGCRPLPIDGAAEANAGLGGSGLAGLTLTAQGNSHNASLQSRYQVGFVFEVIPILPPPGFVDFVPLDISGTMKVQASAAGSGQFVGDRVTSSAGVAADMGPFHADLSVGCVSPDVPGRPACIASRGQNIENVIDFPSSGSEQWDYAGKALVPPLTPLTGSLVAVGTVQLFVEGIGPESALSGSYKALVDPTVVIDPAFPFKDDFEVIFSPGLVASAAVPEASTLLLLGVSLGALSLWRWRDLANAHKPEP